MFENIKALLGLKDAAPTYKDPNVRTVVVTAIDVDDWDDERDEADHDDPDRDGDYENDDEDSTTWSVSVPERKAITALLFVMESGLSRALTLKVAKELIVKHKLDDVQPEELVDLVGHNLENFVDLENPEEIDAIVRDVVFWL